MRRSNFDTYMATQLEAQAETIDVTAFGLTPDAFNAAYAQLLNSRPDLFFVGNSWRYEVSGGYVSYVRPSYTYTGETLSQRKALFNATVARIVEYASAASTPLGKALLVNDYFCLHYEYDTTYSIYSADGLFIEGTGVCQAYMLGFRAVMNALGFTNTTATSQSMSHTWNMLYLDGSWYHIDVSWNDPPNSVPYGLSHRYFLLSDSGITAAGHYGWTATVTADNAQYDDFFWRDVKTPIPVVENTLYYVDQASSNAWQTAYAWTVGATASTELMRFSIADEYGGYARISGFSPLFVTNGRLYFTARNEVRSVALDGTGERLECQLGDSQTYIWSGILSGNTLSLYVSDMISGDGTIITVTLGENVVSLSALSLELIAGQMAGLTASVAPAQAVSWRSENTTVAVVDENGVVIGVAPGSTRVVAECADGYAACTVTVREAHALTLPAVTSEVAAGAFVGGAFVRVAANASLQMIGAGAFADCAALRVVELGASVMSIADDAFAGFKDLTIVCPAGSYAADYATAQGIAWHAPLE